MFVLFYSRLGHRIDGRESGDQVQMRSFMPRLQKLKYLRPAAAAAAAERTAGGERKEGEGSRQKPAICLGFLSNDFSLLFSSIDAFNKQSKTYCYFLLLFCEVFKAIY